MHTMSSWLSKLHSDSGRKPHYYTFITWRLCIPFCICNISVGTFLLLEASGFFLGLEPNPPMCMLPQEVSSSVATTFFLPSLFTAIFSTIAPHHCVCASSSRGSCLATTSLEMRLSPSSVCCRASGQSCENQHHYRAVSSIPHLNIHLMSTFPK